MPVLRRIWKTAWLREELELADVLPEVRKLFPLLIKANTSSTEATSVSVNPTTTTWCNSECNLCEMNAVEIKILFIYIL